MATLATLTQVKAKLDVLATDTSLDTAIQAVLDAASAFVVSDAGYTLSATALTEVFRNVPRDGTIYTAKRPITTLASVKIRDPGSAVLTTITGDLVDAARGEIILVPDLAGWGWPTYDVFPRSARYRLGEWSILQVDYTPTATAAATYPDLTDAEAELAAYWYREHRANAKSVTSGLGGETFLNMGIPPSIQAILRKHKRRSARWV